MPMNEPWPKPTAQSLPDQVARLILQRIAGGEFPPGHRLPSQRDLAQSMGVGLAVVREAVQRLQALSIVDASHGSGTTVLPFRWMPLIYDPSLFMLAVKRIGVRDLWETRRLLEVQIARLAAERAREANLREMRTVLDRAAPLPADYGKSQALNREFHLALARGAQNAVLEDLLAPLLDVRIEGIDHHFTAEMSRRTWEAHEAIYVAVAKHDTDASERAMHEHFKVGPIAVEAEAEGPVIELRRPGKSPPRRRPRRDLS